MFSTTNVGSLDRIIRAVVAVALVAGGLWTLPGAWSWVAIVAGFVAGATALVRSCPLYTLLGISSCRRPSGGRRPA
ncbi:YgaP family membrane protein [Lutibaculum baratangense]|uniref:Inner membrane protein YgaP-like transmembrane domain-containing protein n=1 Tax=Lutibaculum baratangense AMV1 TaxID=631454 RepID=V4RQ48_9HYPH|nr:DUF2892 domain-containing protein [Lutibaculum baratangense]ESR25310.1 hypothetical protein N177_1827 [Lutibaculum baratangense AMV1]